LGAWQRAGSRRLRGKGPVERIVAAGRGGRGDRDQQSRPDRRTAGAAASGLRPRAGPHGRRAHPRTAQGCHSRRIEDQAIDRGRPAVSLVLDASVTLGWYFEDERTAGGDAVLDRVTQSGAVVPTLWRYEVANGLQMAV